MTLSSLTIADLVPHTYPMILIDTLIEAQDDFIHTQVKIQEGIPFYDKGKVPSYVGLEYMAQSIATWNGVLGHKEGHQPKIGFLVGTRSLKLQAPFFHEGMLLDIYGKLIFNSDNMASFDCWITYGSDRLCEGRLNVYQPEDPSLILHNSGITP